MFVPRLGSLLTPARIARILAQADAGYPAAWHDLLNEIRQKDPPLHSVLQTRELGLLSCGWQISPWKSPNEEDATPQDEDIAGYCREAIGEIEGFDRGLAHLLDGTYKGYSVCETEWTKRGGNVVPACLHAVQGRRFMVTPDQKLVHYDDGIVNPPVDVLGLYPRRFVVYTPRVNGDALSREGLGRCLVWFSAFATWGWRDWMLFAELFGKPRTKAEYDPEAYQSETDTDIKAALDALIGRGYTIVPKGVTITTEWPGGGKNGDTPSPSIIDKCAEWQALATLGQRATISDVSNGLGGSGDARDLVRKDVLKADDVALSACVRQQILRPMVEMKFGPNAKIPLFGFNVEEPTDLKSFAEGVSLLAPLMKVPARYVYETTGIPQPVGDEEVLEVETAEPADAAMTGPSGAAATPMPMDAEEAATGATGPTGPEDLRHAQPRRTRRRRDGARRRCARRSRPAGLAVPRRASRLAQPSSAVRWAARDAGPQRRRACVHPHGQHRRCHHRRRAFAARLLGVGRLRHDCRAVRVGHGRHADGLRRAVDRLAWRCRCWTVRRRPLDARNEGGDGQARCGLRE